MSRMGTDVMALACIMGSAALGGAVTLAALDRDAGAEVVCVSELHDVQPTVVVATGEGSRTMVVRPNVRIHSSHGCESVVVDVDRAVEVRMDEVRARMEAARVRMEEAQLRMEDVRIQFDEQHLDQEMKRLSEELARLGEDVGR